MSAEAAHSHTDEAEEEALREKWRQAFDDGRYEDAFSYMHSSVLNRALRWFGDEGVSFARPRGTITPTDLLVGLASASGAELRERGDAASDRLTTAAWAFGVIAEMRLSLDEYVPLEHDKVTRKLAELISHGVMLGIVDSMMTAVHLGWFEKLKAHDLARARQSAGAQQTNAKRASVREQALSEAMRIAGKNATLSHEDVAVKVRDSLSLPTTIKTLTTWVREWRRDGHVTPWKKT